MRIICNNLRYLSIPLNYVLVSAGIDSYPWCTENSYNVCNECNGATGIADLPCSGCNDASADNYNVRSYCLDGSNDDGSPGGNTSDFGDCVQVGGACSGYTGVHTATGTYCVGTQTATSTCKEYSVGGGYGFCRYTGYCNDSTALVTDQVGTAVPSPYNALCAGNSNNNTENINNDNNEIIEIGKGNFG